MAIHAVAAPWWAACCHEPYCSRMMWQLAQARGSVLK
jgi:hypothetical protein